MIENIIAMIIVIIALGSLGYGLFRVMTGQGECRGCGSNGPASGCTSKHQCGQDR